MKNGDYTLVLAPKEFLGKRYRNRYCYEHHLVYWQNYGIVPSAEQVIHHIDGNKRNNDIKNLLLVSRKKHNEKHKQSKRMVMLRCPVCGKVFTRERRNTHLGRKERIGTFCCRSCSGKFASFSQDEKRLRLLDNVISEYITT